MSALDEACRACNGECDSGCVLSGPDEEETMSNEDRPGVCVDCDSTAERGSQFCADCNDQRAEDYEYAMAEDRADRMADR